MLFAIPRGRIRSDPEDPDRRTPRVSDFEPAEKVICSGQRVRPPRLGAISTRRPRRLCYIQIKLFFTLFCPARRQEFGSFRKWVWPGGSVSGIRKSWTRKSRGKCSFFFLRTPHVVAKKGPFFARVTTSQRPKDCFICFSRKLKAGVCLLWQTRTACRRCPPAPRLDAAGRRPLRLAQKPPRSRSLGHS